HHLTGGRAVRALPRRIDERHGWRAGLDIAAPDPVVLGAHGQERRLHRRAVAHAVDTHLAGEAGARRDVAAGARGRVVAVAGGVAPERARRMAEARARRAAGVGAIAQLGAVLHAVAAGAAAAGVERARRAARERAGLEPERLTRRAAEVGAVA